MCYFYIENMMDQDNLDKEGDPPFTLHIGMLFSAICRLALMFCLSGGRSKFG